MNTTRKPYECPEAHLFTFSTVLLGASANVTAIIGDDDTPIINYGGVDTDGSQTPGSRLWDMDEDEDY